VPEVAEPEGLAAWLGSLERRGVRLLLTEPALAVRAPIDLVTLLPAARSDGAVLLVGPEGGWTVDEVALARGAGFVPWTLNPRTLRADAMALAALSVLFYAWEGDQAIASTRGEP
jgi:16S rRNA (uracil1498-N3)-methyltransferase